jgi:hypothetical protein
VVVRDCAGYCSSSPIRLDLVPGQSAPINRTTGEHKYFSVTSAAGERLGCVDLYYKTPEPGAQTLVSQASPCPPGSHPWHTIGWIVLALVIGLTPVAILFARRTRRR